MRCSWCVYASLGRAPNAVVVECIECQRGSSKEVIMPSPSARKTPAELWLEQLKRHQSSKVGGQPQPWVIQRILVNQRDVVLLSRAPRAALSAGINSLVDNEDNSWFRPLRSRKEKASYY